MDKYKVLALLGETRAKVMDGELKYKSGEQYLYVKDLDILLLLPSDLQPLIVETPARFGKTITEQWYIITPVAPVGVMVGTQDMVKDKAVRWGFVDTQAEVDNKWISFILTDKRVAPSTIKQLYNMHVLYDFLQYASKDNLSAGFPLGKIIIIGVILLIIYEVLHVLGVM